jgi:hypothetical protein
MRRLFEEKMTGFDCRDFHSAGSNCRS